MKVGLIRDKEKLIILGRKSEEIGKL